MSPPSEVEQRMHRNLVEAFSPQHLRINDDSPLHEGHSGAREGGGTHFSITLVSAKFEGLSLLQRNRAVHKVLAEELRSQVHALSLDLHTPSEQA